MTTINAIAHLNGLTKDVKNDYYLTPQVVDTLDVAAIVERIRKREVATKNVDGASFIQTFLDECATATAEGNNVVTSFFRSSIGIKGVIYSEDLGHPIPANRLEVSVNLTQGEGARKAIENVSIYAFEQAGATGPVIQTIQDPTERRPGHLNLGGMVLIQGMRLSLRGEDESVGVLFTSEEGDKTAFVPVAQIYPNTPSKLQFVLPATVTEGFWKVAVTTQASSGRSSSLLKSPRTHEYPELIAVGNVGGGEDDRPGEL